MARGQDGVSDEVDWGRVFGWFAIGLAVEAVVFILVDVGLAAWQIGVIAAQSAFMGILSILPRSWDMRAARMEILELRAAVEELADSFGGIAAKVEVVEPAAVEPEEPSVEDDFESFAEDAGEPNKNVEKALDDIVAMLGGKK